MVDFSGLVLAPAMAVFGGPITFTPTVSQPGVAPFPARGVLSQRPVRVDDGNGGYWSTLETTLGIRLADYPVPPKQGDSLARAGVTWFVWDVNRDGQGGANLVVKEQRPPHADDTDADA